MRSRNGLFRVASSLILDGQLGHNHPTIGWYCAVDFERDAKRDAISSIQWVLDEYGQIFTYEILDMEEYAKEQPDA